MHPKAQNLINDIEKALNLDNNEDNIVFNNITSAVQELKDKATILKIKSKEDFINFINSDKKFETVELFTNINFENENIPKSKSEFRGIFNGNGYILSWNSYQCFFDNLINATIKNLILINCQLTQSMTNCTVEKCKIEFNIENTAAENNGVFVKKNNDNGNTFKECISIDPFNINKNYFSLNGNCKNCRIIVSSGYEGQNLNKGNFENSFSFNGNYYYENKNYNLNKTKDEIFDFLNLDYFCINPLNEEINLIWESYPESHIISGLKGYPCQLTLPDTIINDNSPYFLKFNNAKKISFPNLTHIDFTQSTNKINFSSYENSPLITINAPNLIEIKDDKNYPHFDNIVNENFELITPNLITIEGTFFSNITSLKEPNNNLKNLKIIKGNSFHSLIDFNFKNLEQILESSYFTYSEKVICPKANIQHLIPSSLYTNQTLKFLDVKSTDIFKYYYYNDKRKGIQLTSLQTLILRSKPEDNPVYIHTNTSDGKGMSGTAFSRLSDNSLTIYVPSKYLSSYNNGWGEQAKKSDSYIQTSFWNKIISIKTIEGSEYE